VRCEFLEDVMEYELSRSEIATELEVPLINDVRRAAGHASAVKHAAPAVFAQASSEVKRGGTVALAEIAAQVALTPREARVMLRRLKIPKPAGSWQWPREQANEIAAKLEKARRR
jgi:hypothetical protein